MKRSALYGLFLGALAWTAPALAQSINLPANSIYGRMGIGPGPGQAIPFTSLATQIFNSGVPLPLSQARTVVAAPLKLYVNPTGATANCDGQSCQAGSAAASNDCTTIGLPCTSINQAINLAVPSYDARLQQVTIQLSDGTYAAANVQMTANMVGARSGGNGTQAQLIIQGNTSDQSAVIVQGASASAFTFVGVTSPVSLRFMTINTTGVGSHAINADFGSRVYYGNITFGVTGGAHMVATYLSAIEQEGPETISGNFASHWIAGNLSQILMQNFTITCTGAFASSAPFVQLGSSTFTLGSSTFSGCGSITGTRYSADINSTFGFGTADPNTLFPGNANGTVVLPSYNLTGILLGNGGGPTGASGPATALASASNSLIWWNGGTLANLATANNGVLVTDGSGVPSIGPTLPTAVQQNISATNLTTGTLPAARMPALTGDCTTTVGTVATTCTGINGVNQNTAWSIYTPSLGCGAGTLTTASATGRAKTLGKTVFWEATVTITTNNTCATNLQIGLPTAAASFIYTANGVETALTNKAVSCNIGAGASVCLARFYDSTYPAANGSVISISGLYEIP